MLNIFRVATSILAVTVAGVGCQQAPRKAPSSRKTLRLTMAPPMSVYHQLGETLIDLNRTRLPDVDIELRQSAGAVDDVKALQRGDADIGTTNADVAYFAYVGQLEPEGKPFDGLRGIALLPLTPINVVVRADSGIHDVAGLRGKRVGVVGTGATLSAHVVLKAYGADHDLIHFDPIAIPAAAKQIAAGTLDAVFVNGYPQAVRPLVQTGARILTLSDSIIDRLRGEYPFLRPTRTLEDEYSEGGVRTIGVYVLLVCRSDVDEELVYRFTKAFFEVLPILPTMSPMLEFLRAIDVEQAPATPVPLHDGAARFYREREVSR